METLFIFIGILVLLVIMIITIHNGIISRRNTVVRSWSNVITYERQKNVTLPELEKHAAEYKEHESELLSKITALRSAIDQASSGEVRTDDLKAIETHTASMLGSFKVAVEAYPNLEMASITKSLMKEISELQENIAAAITIFNRNVEAFNTGIQTFPNSLVNSMFTKEQSYQSFQNEAAVDSLGFTLQRGE
ncbi:LemA family protein [Kordiimonas sp. SCSIO 12610]|uniref:LemA family protein n=1 Tax=Kordiimonas sp. SCSIO 12610 TaxID=2829597 RepID=UPI002109382E|nr:LemA family protein [Kordiimonas sp. SCSIO 12610]UTW55995.1 LemA family protein [Kordiimonas sp. SCSIO 12610]